MQSRFFRTRDGLRLHYLSHPCALTGSNSYCILLHGFTNDAHVWHGLAGVLQAEHHVIALDLRGHGDSDWDPERKYSHWQLAEDLQDLLASLNDANVHIVGHSLGARIALLALASAPRQATSLTLVDAGPEVSPEAGERLVNDVMQLPDYHTDAQSYRDCLARIYMMADAEALAHVACFGLRVERGRLRRKTDPAFTPGVWHKSPEFRRIDKKKGELGARLWQALGVLEIPVHIVRGQASSILEQSLALRMLEVLGERGRLSVVPRAGHAVMLDNPAKSAALIAQFIQNNASDACVVRHEKELESRV